MVTCDLPDEAATRALGARLAVHLRKGDVITLSGDLGAGKTTLVRGCLQALLGDIEVPSPTYTLVQTYQVDAFELWHCDLYRLERPEDGFELGLIDMIGEAVLVLEWPDRLGDYLPEDHLSIDLTFAKKGRQARISAGPSWQVRLERLKP